MDRPLRLESFLPFRLSVASNAVSERVAGAYRQRFGISIPDWRIIAILGEEAALTQRQIVDRARMDKVTVNRAVRTLVERGLIERSAHGADQRSHRLALTDAGHALYKAVAPQALALEEAIFGGFEPWERAALMRLLERAQAAAMACT